MNKSSARDATEEGLISPWSPRAARFAGLRALCWDGWRETDECLVFLHGLGDGADIWRPVLSAWPAGADRPALALDLPGHGGSDWNDERRYDVPALAEAVVRALKEAGVERPVLIGHSLGARVALELAQQPVTPALTILIDMSPDPGPNMLGAVEDHLDALMIGGHSSEAFLKMVASRLPLSDAAAIREAMPAMASARSPTGSPGSRLILDPAIKDLLSAADKADPWRLLASARSPIALVRGKFSSALDDRTHQRMTAAARVFAGAVTIGGAGHAIPLEQPKALASALAGFVRAGTSP